MFDPFLSLGGYYQSLLLHHFFTSGLFDLLTKPLSPESIARRLGWRPRELKYCLEFLRATTGLVDRDQRGRFRLAISEAELRSLRFHVIKFIGAYGPAAVRLDRALQDPATARSLVDHRALANAFSGVQPGTRRWIVPMILGAQITSLLDMGCGSAPVLIELAGIDHRFRGTGIDLNRQMCRLARANARARGVSRQVRIICADARDVRALPDAAGIHAASLLNELFADGTEEAVRFLVRLKKRFPKRDCWFVDYYGQLGYNSRVSGSAREITQGILHDMIQLLSGQGIPPPDLRSWRAIYKRSGVKLIEAHQFEEHGLTWFVHRVRT